MKIMNNFILILLSFISFIYANILNGLDVLEEKGFLLFQNKDIGLVINHTSLNKDGVHILDLLSNYTHINIKSIFTPEHGLKGRVSAGEKIYDIPRDDFNIDIISLYGKKKEPDLSDVENLDYIIFDIQDIGSRYYTYVSTLTYILNIASIADVPVIVLDRPNPLGRKVSGPIISSEFYSFVGMHPIPIRHGMTIGELALMINEEGWLDSKKKASLEIIKIQNWNKAPGYFSIPPSPNISNFSTALIYNGMCLLEGTNISEGRGTETPFLLFGSPWMNAEKILKDLIKSKIPGVKFYLKTFKPKSIEGAKYPKYENELCNGIKIDIVDSSQINPLKLSLVVLKSIYEKHPQEMSFNNNDFIMNLYGNKQIKENIINAYPLSKLLEVWELDSKYFHSKRMPYLLY